MSSSRRDTPRRFRDELLCGPFLVLVGLFAFVVGGRDGLVAEGLESQLVGLSLAAIGALILFSGAAVMARDRKWTRQLAVIASALASLLGIWLAVAQVRTGDPSALIWVWVGIAVLGVASGIVAYRRREPWTDLSRTTRGALVSVGSLAFMFTLFQFYYTAFYLPSRQKPALTLTTEVQPGPGVGDFETVTGTITVKNTSGTRVRILGSIYNIVGWRVEPRSLGRAALREEFAQPPLTDQLPASAPRPAGLQFVESTDATSVQADSILGQGEFIFEPNEEFTIRVVGHVPEGQFDVIRLTAEVIVVKADKLAFEGQPEFPAGRELTSLGEPPQRFHEVMTRQAISENSWLRDLLRDQRFLVNEWVVDTPNWYALVEPYLSTSFDRGQQPDVADYERELTRLFEDYGVASTYSSSEVALEE